MSALAETRKIGGAMMAQKDILVAILVIGVICLMIVPLPSFVLDVLLTVMISVAVVILLISMYIQNVLDLSVFPGMLLMITLFRLGLNVAATRLILSGTTPGRVI